LEIPRDLLVGLVVDRIPLALWAGSAVDRIRRDRSVVWAVDRIRRDPLAGSGSDAATALGCCASRSIGATSGIRAGD